MLYFVNHLTGESLQLLFTSISIAVKSSWFLSALRTPGTGEVLVAKAPKSRFLRSLFCCYRWGSQLVCKEKGKTAESSSLRVSTEPGKGRAPEMFVLRGFRGSFLHSDWFFASLVYDFTALPAVSQYLRQHYPGILSWHFFSSLFSFISVVKWGRKCGVWVWITEGKVWGQSCHNRSWGQQKFLFLIKKNGAGFSIKWDSLPLKGTGAFEVAGMVGIRKLWLLWDGLGWEKPQSSSMGRDSSMDQFNQLKYG